MTPCRRLVLIESLGRGRLKLPEDERRVSVLISSFSRLSFSFFSNATRRDVTRCFTSAYETRKDDTHARADGRTRNVFLQRRVLLSQIVSPLRSHTSFPSPDSSRLRSVLYPRGGQSLLFIPYPLFFILSTPVCLGRQTRVPRMA